MQTQAIVVFSHLRWNFVFQRPQHLLSRFARQRQVFFIEEPLLNSAKPPGWDFHQPIDNLFVCAPRTPCLTPGYNGEQLPLLAGLLQQLKAEHAIESPIAWLYTPMALPLVDPLYPALLVYDCMDDLSAFKFAPIDMLQRESELMARADVVFTGGPSLYRAKRSLHANVHCFPSSVDASHFGRAKRTSVLPAESGKVRQPMLGYVGVIDERIDLGLLEALADRHPQWQIEMVGPVAKIDQALLPVRANISYLGQRSYQELPALIAGWDLCLMPFAINEATRSISPTKVLEYMAAERPVVSTPIRDVVEPYGDIVYVADGPDAFVAACETALAEDVQERARRLGLMRQVISATSWDDTAARMDRLIREALERKRGPAVGLDHPDSEPASVLKTSDDQTIPSIIIGAGPTGLSAAYHLGSEALLLEQEQRVGGWCRSLEVSGFTFDFAGHIMFSNDSYVHQLYELLLGDNVHWQDREAWIFSHGVHTRYPFQGSLYGLPADVIKECILGAIEARLGIASATEKSQSEPRAGESDDQRLEKACEWQRGARPARFAVEGNGDRLVARENGGANGHALEQRPVAPVMNDCCADGILESTVTMKPDVARGENGCNGSNHRAKQANGKDNDATAAHANGKHKLSLPEVNGHGTAGTAGQENFEQFIYRVWGRGIAKHFAIPYNRKLWAVPLSEMDTSWLGGRVPMPNLEEMIEGALQPSPKPMGPNARFGYPLRGGFQALMDGFLPHVKDRLCLGVRVVKIEPREHRLTLSGGKTIRYHQLISTMPLPVLVKLMEDRAPSEVRDAAAALRHVSVRCVHLGVGRENLTDKHWIYYPEETVFHRIFLQGNASPHCNAPGGFGLTCEITYSPAKPLPCQGDALVQRCIDDCRKVGLMNADDPVVAAVQCDLPYAYVVYDFARASSVARVRSWLEEHDILLAGRYSEWEYYNSDHAFLAGKKVAESARRRLANRVPKAALATVPQPC